MISLFHSSVGNLPLTAIIRTHNKALRASPQRASLCRRHPLQCWSDAGSSSPRTDSSCHHCSCLPYSGRCRSNWKVFNVRNGRVQKGCNSWLFSSWINFPELKVTSNCLFCSSSCPKPRTLCLPKKRSKSSHSMSWKQQMFEFFALKMTETIKWISKYLEITFLFM